MGKFGLGVQNEAGQRLIEFCQENTLVIANTLFQQHKRRLYTWTSPDGQYWNQIDYIFLQPKMEKSYTVSKNKTGHWLWLRSWTTCCQFRLKLKKVGKTSRLERSKAGGERDDRGWDGWMASSTQWTWVWVSSGLMDREAFCAAVHWVVKSRTWLSDWTELKW